MLKKYADENNVEFTAIYDIDTEEGAAIAQKYAVRGVPMVIRLDDDVEKGRLLGMDINKFNELRNAS
jgi:hypothetical protein